jgi:Concanavalin A-like lectin/glucanases superfamily
MIPCSPPIYPMENHFRQTGRARDLPHYRNLKLNRPHGLRPPHICNLWLSRATRTSRVLTLSLLCLLLSTFCFQTPSHAACSNPTHNEADMFYNHDYHVLQYCNGTNWIAIGPVPGAGGSGCLNPAGAEGDALYNHDYHVMQYCDGTNWIAIGGPGVPMNGLVGWWKFDDGSGSSATDSSDNNNTGTLQNSPTWTTGMDGGALTFDGASNYVEINDSSSLDTGDVASWSLWFKRVRSGVNYETLFSKGNGTMVVAIGAGGGNQISVNGSGLGNITTCGVSVTDTDWHYLAVTKNGSATRVYLDGADCTGTVTNQTLVNNSASLLIGVDNWSGTGSAPQAGTYFEGTIDDVRIYNRALSAGKVAQLYDAGMLASLNHGLVGWWKLDDGSGSMATDSSGQGDTGTLINAPTWGQGKIGGDLTFDGATQEVDASGYAGITSNVFTISFWLKSTSGSEGGPLGVGFDVHLTTNGGGDSVAVWGVDGGGNGPSFSLPHDGVWRLLTLVNNGSAQWVYVNGVLAATGTYTPIFPGPNTSINMGAGSYHFNGSLDDVRIYNRALTDAEVKALYGCGPGGNEADMIYNADFHDMQYCNGMNWIAMGPTLSTGPTSGLVGWWKFDEGSGTTTADSSGNGYTGTLYNSPTWITGQIGGGMSFNGTNQYVDAGSGPDISSLPFTLAAWIKPQSNGTIISKRNNWAAGSMRFDWQRNSDTGGGVILQSYPSTWTFSYVPPIGVWTHLAVVATSSSTDLYVNGVFNQSISPFTLGTDATADLTFGSDAPSDTYHDYYNGAIDDARIYNRALSASEVWDLYLATGGT